MQGAVALEAGAPVLESTTYWGDPVGDACHYPQLSPSGRYLTFSCPGPYVVPEDSNARNDTFIRDRELGTTRRLSVDSLGLQYPYDSWGAKPSDDGRAVFNSYAPLVPGLWWTYPMAGAAMTYLRDVNAGTTTLLSRRADGAPANAEAYMQGNANFATNEVGLGSYANLFTGSVTIPIYYAYVRNWSTGVVEAIGVTPDGEQANGGSGFTALSYDGRYVAFLSAATNITDDNPSGELQLFLRDRSLQETRRLTFPVDGSYQSPLEITSTGVQFTADNRYVLFSSPNRELAQNGEDLPYLNVFLLDLGTTEVQLASTGSRGQIPDDMSTNAEISADGRYLAFFSRATNLLDTPQPPAVYVKDRWTGEMLNLSSSLGPLHQFTLPPVAISADGSTVAFEWRHAPETPIVGGRTLIYSVELGGAPSAPEAVPVPFGRTWLWIGMMILIIGIGARRLREINSRILGSTSDDMASSGSAR